MNDLVPSARWPPHRHGRPLPPCLRPAGGAPPSCLPGPLRAPACVRCPSPSASPVSRMRTQPSRSGWSHWRVAERGSLPAPTPWALQPGDRAGPHLWLRRDQPCPFQLATCRPGPQFPSCKLTLRSSGGRCGDGQEAGSGGPGWPGPQRSVWMTCFERSHCVRQDKASPEVMPLRPGPEPD